MSEKGEMKREEREEEGQKYPPLAEFGQKVTAPVETQDPHLKQQEKERK